MRHLMDDYVVPDPARHQPDFMRNADPTGAVIAAAEFRILVNGILDRIYFKLILKILLVDLLRYVY